MATTTLLRINNLGCSRQQRILFSQLSFCLNAGEILLIEGPNGSGKSSLLRLIAGLATPEAGEISWQEQTLESDREAYASDMHFIGHSNGLKLGLTVKENLHLIAQLNNLSLPAHYTHVLTQLHLDSYQDTLTKHLSAGQKRRVALARLLLITKKLWLVDEPFTALDVSVQNFFLEQLENHLSQGGICVMSSHHPITNLKRSIQTLRLGSC